MPDASRSELQEMPERRPLRVYAFDPSRGRLLGNEMQIDVRYRPLLPGPVDQSGLRNQIAVVDYEIRKHRYYKPVNLNLPSVLVPNGICPSESDPRFHQQMVYAVASDTVEQFESALGRRIHWRRADRPSNARKGWLRDDILTLMLFPHAMRDANAFYSPQAHGILFGYFEANCRDPGRNLPGQTVFTCLSHDIIVHETTHAILDGLRSHFMEQTNPDVAAFHEGFADLVALFRHFTHREVLLDAIKRSGGRLYTSALKGDALADRAAQAELAAADEERNPLIELAGQFGEAAGMRRGLRSAIGKPRTMEQLRDTLECHDRGAILVAAVFDAFFTVYIKRAARHFRVHRSAGGVEREDLTDALAEALAEEASRTATQFLRTCIRALDYLPPVDVTFGDFLRAVLTSETSFDPVDREGIRYAWMEAFRRRRILPDDAPYFSEVALCWPDLTCDTAPRKARVCEVRGLPFGSPMGLTYREQQQTAAALKAFIETRGTKELLQLDPAAEYTIPSFHPLYHVDRNNSVRWNLVAEVLQTIPATESTYPLRGGTTVIISTHGTISSTWDRTMFVRHVIPKPLHGAAGRARVKRQADYLETAGFRRGAGAEDLRINFALVHGGS